MFQVAHISVSDREHEVRKIPPARCTHEVEVIAAIEYRRCLLLYYVGGPEEPQSWTDFAGVMLDDLTTVSVFEIRRQLDRCVEDECIMVYPQTELCWQLHDWEWFNRLNDWSAYVSSSRQIGREPAYHDAAEVLPLKDDDKLWLREVVLGNLQAALAIIQQCRVPC